MPTLNRPGFSTLHYDEVVKNTPSPEYFLIHGAAKARRTIDVDWNRLNDAIKMFLGFPQIAVGGNYGSWISRILPDQIRTITSAEYYNFTNSSHSYLFASQIERVEPVAATGQYDTYGVAIYQKARLYIIYEAPTYPIKDDQDSTVVQTDPRTGIPIPFADESRLNRFVTPTYKPSAEFLNLPRGTVFKWVDSTQAGIDYATNVLLPSTEIQLNWHQVPLLTKSLNISNITKNPNLDLNNLVDSPDSLPTACSTHVGKANKTTFLGHPPGTLLLLGVDTRRYKLATGTNVWDINYRIKYVDPNNNSRGVNWFLHYNKLFVGAGYVEPVDRYEITTTGQHSNPADWGDFGTRPQTAKPDIPVFGYAEFRFLFQPI